MRTADFDVTPYLIGDTAYFSVGSVSCGIHANGDVGCDIPAGMAKWYDVIPVTDLAIDAPFLPAHPTFGVLGPHGRQASPQLPDPNGYGSILSYGSTISYGNAISYAGATCFGGGRGAIRCSSKGHSFSFGWSGTQTS
jgi:hypothetical protein